MTPSLGVEIEFGAFAPGRPIGRSSHLPKVLLSKIQEQHRCVRSASKSSGVFTCGGQMYLEMDRFLEISSYPGTSPAAAMAAEDAAIEVLAGAAQAARLPEQGFALTCLADDLTRTRDPEAVDEQPRHGHSMGYHVNLVLPTLTARHQQAFLSLAALLPEITGPGGFVRDLDGQLRFRRDPRAAHVQLLTHQAAHYAGKPILKMAEQAIAAHATRIQLTSFGWTPGRLDRRLRYGLLMLLAAACERGDLRSDFTVCDPLATLHALPGQDVEYALRGTRRRACRLRLLEVLLDEVLAPAAETVPWGSATLASIRTVLEEVRACRDVDEVALRVPLHWAIRQHVFSRLCAESGVRLPVHGVSADALPSPEMLARLALLSVLDQDILCSRAREWMLGSVRGQRWTHAEVFGRDPEAVRSVTEDRVPECTGRVGERFEECVAAAASVGAGEAGGQRRAAVDWVALNS